MLIKLSESRKEIALSLLSIFLISGLVPLKASASSVRAITAPSFSDRRMTNNKAEVDPLLTSSGTSDSKGHSISFATPKNALYNTESMQLATETLDETRYNQPLIGGPGQPEMGAFKSVNSDNMVDLFTGDMSYNIPLLDVGGYPVNIFYNSGITMDQEASWVGLGWNINPGTIMRNMRGIPDDFNGTDKITKTQSFRPDKTWGIGIGGGVEAVSLPVGISSNLGVSFNNQRGMGMEFGVGAHANISADMGDDKTASLSLGVGLNLSSQGGATVTPSIGLSLKEGNDTKGSTSTSGSLSASIGYNSRAGLQSLHLDAEVSKTKTSEKALDPKYKSDKYESQTGTLGAMSSSISFAYPSITPSIRTRLSRLNMSASIKLGYAVMLIHPNATLNGYYSQTRIADEDKVTSHSAYGIMHYQDAKDDEGALLDFNRLQDGVFTKTNPTISVPTYNYDVFSVSGEGVGGSFRAYRGDLGYMRDAKVATRDDAGKIGFDIGLGPLASHVGVNLEYVYSPAYAGSWDINNLAKNTLQFRDSKADYQSVYFKNPGEKTIPDIKFQNAVGGEDLVRLKMTNYKTGAPTLLPILERFDGNRNYLTNDISLVTNDIIKNRRDKRTQVTTFLSAEEAARVGFDKTINSYDAKSANVVFGKCSNSIQSIERTAEESFRKKHHISEIDVLGADGRKYVYGIPVYNKRQIDVNFNVSAAGADKDAETVDYNSGTDDTKANQKNKDWYIQKEEMPPYAHAYLLTSLVSPNYVDVTGDGVSEDDMGDAVKFNYTKFDDIKWRTPIGDKKASYSDGFKTTIQDDKAHYVYGEREQWYLYSIESKNLVARFHVSNNRRDGKQVLDSAGKIDRYYGAKLLDKIELFSKADLIKLGLNAKPIKTVHFTYDYSLCGDVPTNDGVPYVVGDRDLNENRGKLTLRSIYFTYNGNTKLRQNSYSFNYGNEGRPGGLKNPKYDFTSSDRWGTYKPKAVNPGELANSDYPYSIHELTSADFGSTKTNADKHAAAWVLDNIKLPSGGSLDIEYESDDYAYVQDRHAASMYKISGFGSTSTPNATQIQTNQLYEFDPVASLMQHKAIFNKYNYMYIKVPYAIDMTVPNPKAEVQARYFNSGANQILVKLAIQIPNDDNSNGMELVPFYLDVNRETGDYGPVPIAGSTTSDIIFVRIPDLKNHPATIQHSLQFLKNNLPAKAFPGYDNTDGGLKSVIIALGGILNALKELAIGVDNNLMLKNKCKQVITEQSFARLTNPYFKKYGGGLRVKKVIVNDNWFKMTKQPDAQYGQEYHYTTTETINGKVETISSGVASWEPSIGGEENPHREAMTYYNHNKGGPYDYNSVELPLAEMFFPSANVGYQHVEVMSINRTRVKNAVGKTVSEFYTTKDFPAKSDFTYLEDRDGGGASFHEDPTILAILNIKAGKHYALSQGFRVSINDMNGKLRLEQALGAQGQLISQTENFYNIKKETDNTYSFNHLLPVLAKANGEITSAVIGRDIEIMTDFRHHNSQTVSTNLNLNLDGQMIGPFPLIVPPFFSPVFFEENDYRAASLLKVINHYGVLDSVVHIDKGSMISTKNLVFDGETGNALLTRTQNEHNKPLYNFSYPAHWAYSGMGPAYQNIDVQYDGLTFRKGILENPGGTSIDFKHFESGDELYVYSPLANRPFPLPCEAFVCPELKNPANRIWAVNANKLAGGNPSFVFMDASGMPYDAVNVSMRIIRSGHRNMLEQMVGTVTSLKRPTKLGANGNEYLHFEDEDNLSQIINTGAATFKDHWRVDDRLNNNLDSIPPVYNPPSFVVCRGDTIKPYAQCGAYIYNNNFSAYGPPVFNGTYITDDFWQSSSMLNCGYQSVNVPGGREQLGARYLIGDSLPNKSKNTNTNTITSDCVILNAPDSIKDSKGPLNRNSVWACCVDDTTVHTSSPLNRWIGFSETFMVPEAKTYFIGMGADNAFRLKVDGVLVRELSNSANVNFNLWHIYPIDLNAGTHIIEMEGLNTGSYAGFGVEIYNNTRAEIETSTGYKGDPSNIHNTIDVLFSTKQMVGKRFQSGIYQCPPGYALNTSSGNPALYNCVKINSNNCQSKFTDQFVNPYVEGIFGNWRLDLSYTYYGERRETDPNPPSPIDTRTAGTIDNYRNFWNLSNPAGTEERPYLTINESQEAGKVWVWNSMATQYNRKGYEVENKDALLRYNAGLYGYNQQLPIAVANNARLREIMYDGFEDYDYESAPSCIEQACELPRHAVFADFRSYITQLQKHTGRYSLQVKENQTISLNAQVAPGDAELPYGFNINVPVTSCNDQRINKLTGKGLTKTLGPDYIPVLTPKIDFNFRAKKIKVEWEGYILPTITGTYSFESYADDWMEVTIHNGTSSMSFSNFHSNGGLHYEYGSAQLTKGVPCHITITTDNRGGGPYRAQLKWKTPEMICNGAAYDFIPTNQLYTANYTPAMIIAEAQIQSLNINVPSLTGASTTGQALTDRFKLVQGQKMVVSAWVKESLDCQNATYVNNEINVLFDGGATGSATFQPTGNIIEGWQRYEGVFDVPSNANEFTLSLKNLGQEGSVFFDDIRIHPFHANEKSFVYHSSNLRLMAELDENNYASFYEYDDDGTLARVKKETERGVKTIQETRSGLIKVKTN